jgi:Zn-dependent protease
MTGDPGVSVGVPRNAFVPSPVFVGVLALVGVSGWMTWTGFGNVRVDVFLLVISGWLVSLCLHEYAHAVVAYFSGDHGVAERGYLRLNPLKYTHPLLSIGLPIIAVILGGIGLPGGAVWVDHQHIRSKVRQSLVSLAGPATNILFALVLAIPFMVGLADVPELRTDALGQTTLVAAQGSHLEFWSALALLAFLQVTASILNLLPVPGLDGGNLIFPWLNDQWKRAFNLMAPYGFILLFAALWQPSINRYFFTAVYWVSEGIGIPRLLSEIGFELMRFWSTWG